LNEITMHPADDNRMEDPLASFLAAADRDAAPPDRAFLERLREQSTQVFREAAARQTQRQRRRRIMITSSVRALAACLAAAILVGIMLFSWLAPRDSGLAFGQVLDRVAGAQTLHLQVTRQGRTADVWVKQPDQLRWDEADGTYQIAHGDQRWLIDEKANRATRQTTSFFSSVDRPGVDLLALLDVPHPPDWVGLRDQNPAGWEQRDGHDCHVYHLQIPAAEGNVELTAWVDATTLRLHALEAKAHKNGTVEPLGEVVVLAVNPPVADQQFAVRPTLTEDGRIGKVHDSQGIVTVKPVLHERWTPVRNGLLLKPGDWVRTDFRGANAVEIVLVKYTHLILGPGTLVELVKPDEVRVFSGELEVSVPTGDTLRLLGPKEQTLTVKGTHSYRLESDKLAELAKGPLWLRGFKGTIAHESIGSLVANVDGRNEPLTVGYHKVTVEIRDQIARTTIEESFVNHTNVLLEGVFFFPLPQDASISGFGMWIGNNLVEADVVEKQRAREIYETILHEKRDPGLLEWSGGNLFKARVYPIFPGSEKRIKITYTQVLPLKGNRYRYSYGLQSEMLQQHPLKELAIDVKVNSVAPLKSVSSPTHPTRTDQTAHSAHVEFSAQEYTPTRDFEVVIEVDGKQSDLVVIPHRRGDDGYFMLQLLPPASVGKWERDLVPDGQPVNLLILADTSASMDAGQRSTQATFLAALLTALTPKDTINVAACDVNCDWVFEKSVPADSANITAARQFLAKRVSLGWTDLDRAFVSAFKRSAPNTQIIYVGDGIVTANGDADPAAFTQRLKRLYEGKAGVCHAVAVGNLFEPGVLRAMASLGGGSVRRITGERGPQAVALELLSEVAQPPLRNLKVAFAGVRTARVYPEVLPNIPAGSQQILLGRYLPEGRDQDGEVVVTGLQGDKPVEFRTRFSLKDAEQGNSFIPRLWARMHLDTLLEQGASESIKDEIIALSEEYQIITPYTSFLVLESDADRERFKVKRQFQMRDGEKFFAQGRDNANYELVQQQMKRAGTWRRGLYRDVLTELARLGRDVSLLQNRVNAHLPIGDVGGKFGYAGRSGGRKAISSPEFGTPLGFVDSLMVDTNESLGDDLRNSPNLGRLSERGEWGVEERAKEVDQKAELRDLEGDFPGAAPFGGGESSDFFARLAGAEGKASKKALSSIRERLVEDDRSPNERTPASPRPWKDRFRNGYLTQPTQWLDGLLPDLPTAARRVEARNNNWPAPARALAQSLLRTEQLAHLKGGIAIDRQTENFDVRWNELASRSQNRALYSPASWLTRAEGDDAQAIIRWCDGKERGVWSRPFQLGRLRTAVPQDLGAEVLGLNDHSLIPLDRDYPGYHATLEPQGEERTVLVLRHPSSPASEVRLVVDTKRHVLLAVEHRHHGKVTSATKFNDFLEVAGSWWARKIEATDDKGRLVSRITQTIQPLTDDALARQTQAELAGRDQTLFIRHPLASIVAAKKALAEGKATLDDHLALLVHFAASQQWARAVEHLQQCEKLATGKPGVRWLHNAFLNISRRHEELKKRLLEEAGRLAEARGADEWFLTGHVVDQGAGFLQGNEMLALLDRVHPVYQRQPAYRQLVRHWKQLRANYLLQVGQRDQALALMKELATTYPHDFSVQNSYAQGLVNAGDYPAASAWLDRVLTKEAQWAPSEEEALRSLYTQFLDGQGRYPDLVEYTAEWIKHHPERSTAYSQHLSALIRINELDKAHALIARWLQEGQVEGELPQAVASRLQVAVYQALGQGYNLYTNRIEERWLAPLAQAVLFFARHDTQSSIADHIMNHGQFQKSDDCRRVRKTIAEMLTTELDKLSADQAAQFVNWILPDDPALEPAAWKRIMDGLRQRWVAAKQDDPRHRLGQALVSVLTSKAEAPERIAFLHRELREGPKSYRTIYARQLFSLLLEQPWSAEYEDEAFALLEQLSDAEDPSERLLAQVQALYQLTDKMTDARCQAKMKAVEHPENLTRTDLQAKKNDLLREARGEFAGRLRQETAKHKGAMVRWLTIERLYLEMLLDQEPEKIAAECWDFLGAEPTALADDSQNSRLLDDVLGERYLLTVMRLAASRGAPPPLVERLQKYLDKGIAGDDSDRWRFFKFQLLIARDDAKGLEQVLQRWMAASKLDNRWRLVLGYLVAEQGRITEAIKHFEAIEAADELDPAAYRALADWYMVVNRREQHDRARVAAFKTLEEYYLSRLIQAHLAPWQQSNQPLPTELNKDVLLLFQALLEKSSYPANYLGLLQSFYQACHDFRLLAGLADAVIGHSAGKVYPFLQHMQAVLSEVRDEATADSIIEHIAKVRARAKTVVDQRALDLLEVLVERRCAELKNQPGPHADKAVAALQRAFKRDWTAGEPLLMGDFLAGLGKIAHLALAREQVRQLETLHQGGAKGSFDRLHLAHRLGEALHAYARTGEAIDLVQDALNEFQGTNNGVLPASANPALDSLVGFLEAARHFARGEKVLRDQLQHPVHGQQKLWLAERLDRLYHHALQNDSQVSLGAGQALYQALHTRIQEELTTTDHNHRYTLVNLLCGVYRTAKDKKLTGVVDDLKAFAFQKLPLVLKYQTNHYQAMVQQTARAVHDLSSSADGVAVLVTMIEKEPAWFLFNNQDGWSQHGWYIGQWRQENTNLGAALEERLLKIVLTELRRDLESQQQRNRVLYHRQYTYFWAEKAEDFAQTAEAVLAQRNQSGAVAKYIADYFYWGLGRSNRAIDILFAAHHRKILDEGGQLQLVDYLHRENRHVESIALLEPWVQRKPEVLHYRVLLMSAYFHASRQKDLLALLKDTDTFFHQKDRWNESVMATLGYSCLENHLFDQCVAYYNEAIPLHQRTHPRRGIGNGTLSSYYAALARAYAGLNKTPEAVEAASGAVVSWGQRIHQRAHALETLKQVLRDAPDLDAYVAYLDAKSAESGRDNPIVRKAIGQAYFAKARYGQAIVQLQLAAELQPNDAETYQVLIDSYDRQNDPEGAIRQLLQSLQLARRDPKRYQDLGQRLEKLERPDESERAYTSIVEVLPNEAESHALLAEVRQTQGRWAEAVVHWEQVARLRALEPTGLLKLAAAQVHLQQWDKAMETLGKVKAKTWPPRFSDVATQVRMLEQQIDKGRNQ
jgi:Flp pilus assembly protein TadD